MNHDEAVDLCRYVAGGCPQQKFDEYTPDVWHDLMADLPFTLALRAVQEVARAQPFVSPAEIRRVLRRMRVTTRRAIKRAARDHGVIVHVEAEADAAICAGLADFSGIDLLRAEDPDARFYNPQVAQLSAWAPARRDLLA